MKKILENFKLSAASANCNKSLFRDSTEVRFNANFSTEANCLVAQDKLVNLIVDLTIKFPDIFANNDNLINLAGSQRSKDLGVILSVMLCDSAKKREREIKLYTDFLETNRKYITFSKGGSLNFTSEFKNSLTGDLKYISQIKFSLAYFRVQGIALFSESTPTLADEFFLNVTPNSLNFELIGSVKTLKELPLILYGDYFSRLNILLKNLTALSLSDIYLAKVNELRGNFS
jgi:hypothetical protein